MLIFGFDNSPSSHIHIIFDEVDEYVKKYDETKYVALFQSD